MCTFWTLPFSSDYWGLDCRLQAYNELFPEISPHFWSTLETDKWQPGKHSLNGRDRNPRKIDLLKLKILQTIKKLKIWRNVTLTQTGNCWRNATTFSSRNGKRDSRPWSEMHLNKAVIIFSSMSKRLLFRNRFPLLLWNYLCLVEEYLAPCQTSKMEHLAKIVDD